MKELFVKKYWAEDNVMFYLHFRNGEAIEQIEITPKSKVFLSVDSPTYYDSMLYDQLINELDLQESDFITQEEFYKIWNKR